MDLKDIKAIIDLMRKNAISEFEMEREGFKIRMKRGPIFSGSSVVEEHVISEAGQVTQLPVAQPSQTLAPTPPPVPAAPAAVISAENTKEIKAPMVGTFYRAPAPDAPPYVDIGAQVNEDTVVCIIEAMKVMNEIKAEIKGTIVQVLVENGKPVEFGQPLFRVRPA